uniref:Uncharacterized protein n=1 Tax=Haptolina ericina TaxID=156174 RepID=A0A7S3FB28_9EUKA
MEKRDAAIFIGGMSTNNSLVADMWLIDGAVETMIHAATEDWGAVLRPVLCRMGLLEDKWLNRTLVSSMLPPPNAMKPTSNFDSALAKDEVRLEVNDFEVNHFHGIPVYWSSSAGDGGSLDKHLLVLHRSKVTSLVVKAALAQNKLVLIRNMPFNEATHFYASLADEFGLRDSYEAQMKGVVHLTNHRKGVGGEAATVNERGEYEVIGAHCEGDTSAPLDFFALHCIENAFDGGENILSLIDQTGDHSKLQAKEKALVCQGLSRTELMQLRGCTGHTDAKDVLSACPPAARVLAETDHGKVILRSLPVEAMHSVVCDKPLVSYFDNVSAHDEAFHRHHLELLRALCLLRPNPSATTDKDYLHIEEGRGWAPLETDHGEVAYTAKLWSAHVVHKMAPGDFLLFNNRAWTHSANNWEPGQVRKMHVMYS